jgi:hypothetical protein
MRACQQSEGQSVYAHGESVRDHMLQLLVYLDTGELHGAWVLPDWLSVYRIQLKTSVMPISVIAEYTLFHDCGKPYCVPDGVRKFPDHAEMSCRTWLSVGGSQEASKLMRMDMLVHTMKADEVPGFCLNPEAITLLLAGLSEVHSNARMFGGLDSVSFKIKWGQINRRGKAICRHLFGEPSHG